MGKKLLVNADDLGLSSAINAGILKAHVDGIVTSASIVAGGEAFDEAVTLARQHPNLGIGVHLTLVEETSITGRKKIPTLAPEGVLPSTYGQLMKGLISCKITLRDVEYELRGQIEKCLLSGLELTHLDSHQHTHAFPPLFQLSIRLAEEYRIPGMRIPRGFPRWSDRSARRFAGKCFLCLLAHYDAFFFRRHGIRVASYFKGLFETGELSSERLRLLISQLPEGTTELVCHPGYADKTGRYANWSANRVMELETLTSSAVRVAILKFGVELISYRNLMKHQVG